jgi:hypothetical protein
MEIRQYGPLAEWRQQVCGGDGQAAACGAGQVATQPIRGEGAGGDNQSLDDQ